MLASRLPGKNECDLTWTCQGIWLAALDSQSKFQRLCWLKSPKISAPITSTWHQVPFMHSITQDGCVGLPSRFALNPGTADPPPPPPWTVDHSSGTLDHRSGTVDHRPLTVNHSSSKVDHSSGTVDHLSGTVDHRSGTVDHHSGAVDYPPGTEDNPSGTVDHRSGI